MKSLALLRHAKADLAQGGLADFDRPLNPRGKGAARMIGKALRDNGASFDLVLTSPAVRAQETLDGMAETYGTRLRSRQDERIYLASPATLLEMIRTVRDDIGRLLIVGHNPGLERLALLLSGGGDLRAELEDGFPTGGLVQIDFACNRWADVGEAGGTIRQLITPRGLERRDG